MSGAAPIEPGATLGVFGGGQLGRMFAVAAARMGYRVHAYAPEPDCPAAQVAGAHTCDDYLDLDAVRAFARACDAVTVEFENVSGDALAAAAECAVARPSPHVVGVAQDRLGERAFLDSHGLPAAPHAAVRSAEDLSRAVAALGVPTVVKSARFGYDGRGQTRINRPDEADAAWSALGAVEALCEAWVEFDCEISVIVARDAAGAIETFGPILNHHVNHILDVSVSPAPIHEAPARDSIELARRVAEGLALEGVLCVEMFLTRDGRLLINELAPRPHNSGHLTIEACGVSQFEQQVRTLCGLPLGRMEMRRPAAAMANLLGDLWDRGAPDWTPVHTRSGVSLHLYGKSEARAGRKMGHLTALAETPAEAEDAVRTARREAAGSPGGPPEGAAPRSAVTP